MVRVFGTLEPPLFPVTPNGVLRPAGNLLPSNSGEGDEQRGSEGGCATGKTANKLFTEPASGEHL